MNARRIASFVVAVTIAAFPMLSAATPAFGYSGGVHHISTQRPVDLMGTTNPNAITGSDQFGAVRTSLGAPIFPQLYANNNNLALALVNSAKNYDSYVGDMGTRNHFWTAAEGLHECPEGIVGVDNAWETARWNWEQAIAYYQMGKPSDAMFYLGAVMHLVEDMGQPAHTNSDLHGPTNRDSLEEWGSFAIAEAMYSWTDSTKTSPGPLLKVPTNQQIINKVRATPTWQPGWSEFVTDPELSNAANPFNLQQLFYIFYVTNETANYFASDGEAGNKIEPLGWVSYAGFPTALHNAKGQHVTPQSETAFDDNDAQCKNNNPKCPDGYCNCDGDLMTVAKVGYRASTRGAQAVLDLFRRTADTAPPVTTVNVKRTDGKPYLAGGWNNSPVTVTLVSASDTAFFVQPSGLWTMWAMFNNKTPALPLATPITTTFTENGWNTVKVRSTDWAGNVEKQDFVVGVDTWKPVTTIFNLTGSYFPCGAYTAKWKSTDAASGLHGPGSATLEGRPLTQNGVVPLLSLSPGVHAVHVSQPDVAGNVAETYGFLRIKDETGTVVATPYIVGGKQPIVRKSFLVAGTLTPRHRLGQRPIDLRFYLLKGGKAVLQKTVPAIIATDGRYKASASFVIPGTYRVNAFHRKPYKLSGSLQFKVGTGVLANPRSGINRWGRP